MSRACRRRPSRLQAEGPLAAYLEPYAEYLAGLGYSQVSYWHKTFLVSKFSQWLGRGGVAINEITRVHEDAFLRDRARRRRPKGGDHIAVSGVTHWLREKGVIECRSTASIETSSIAQILQEYRFCLLEDRGLAMTTIENYVGYVRRFLADVSGKNDLQLASVNPAQVAEYLRRHAPKARTFMSAKHIGTALRSFFRFARSRGYVHGDLAATVPSVAGWSMASIPRAMPADGVQALLGASKTWREPAGLRNRAILLLLARLGFRAGEVVRLELDDIDWSEGCLTVHDKGRAQRPLPLPHDVGEAVAAYLERGRPPSSSRRVFLRSRAPFDGLKSSSDICQIVARAMERAGIESRSRGAHQLRHALAVDMLRQGASLTDIGQVLRHRSAQATRRYAKVDIEGLREVALPWPGEWA
ncbi:tyrosine-type recombinase/integrase [Cupriavidus sp. CP313]